ncbi:hypothetical protein [Limnoglobus roseus]|nr:hypothetical protein [Limnoglobus roseus]
MKTTKFARIAVVMILVFVGYLFFPKDPDRYSTWHETLNKTRKLA